MIQFPRIDVRYGLLTSGGAGIGRHVQQVSIDFTTARSATARDWLERGVAQARMYSLEASRRSFCEASQTARREKDGFVESAAGMLLALQADGTTNTSSQPQFLQDALKVLDYEMFGWSEQFLEQGAPREVTVPILQPRNSLRELIVDNLDQFNLRQDSLLIAETRTNINRLLAQSNWLQAGNVAKIGVENATALFGENHWWVAVMLVRRATALLRQQQAKLAQPLVKRASYIFSEWTDHTADGGVFKQELDHLKTAESNLRLLLVD
jgi:hypothetical protein